jgi:tRNA-specific 2-thiouridylase
MKNKDWIPEQVRNGNIRPKVFVGLSGGVDSSVSAALLVEAGFDVTGVYMKNWTADLPGVQCPWAKDLADAKRIAVQLGIPFRVYDFENEYKDKVVDYMLREYAAGRTPNPDVMCNEEVKFKLFLECAVADGADFIATGHYARNQYNSAASLRAQRSNPVDNDWILKQVQNDRTRAGKLLKAADENKDQTYFLYRVTAGALERTIFPIGEMTKPEVKKAAAQRGLITAARKESMGICFVGEVGIRDFLSQYFDEQPGDIIDSKTGEKVGRHDGAIFYTVGQRHGLSVGGGLPYYVTGKDMKHNVLYVSRDLNDAHFFKKNVTITDVFLRGEIETRKTYEVRVRHRGKLIKAKIKCHSGFIPESKNDWILKQVQDDKRGNVRNGNYVIEFDEPERAIAPGQSIVIYDGEVCLGGGVVI